MANFKFRIVAFKKRSIHLQPTYVNSYWRLFLNKMPVYLVSSYNIHDYDTYKNYPARIAPLVSRYGGRALAMELNP